MDKILVLEDGTTFLGKGFGSSKEVVGEIVFTTSMTGYQELLTDPSFLGQMVTMTFPMVGNYGINRYDYEALKPHVTALIVHEETREPSNFRMEKTLHDYLKKFDIPGISNIDTRKLTKILRDKGNLRGIIVDREVGKEEALRRLENREGDFFKDHIDRVSIKTPYEIPGPGKRIVFYDYGTKASILKDLTKEGFNITVVPWNYKAENALELNPHGIMLSNGPGNPEDAKEAIEIVRSLLGKVPIFGICMGHQILALASGAKTKKMTFGHRGGNNPVMDLKTNKIYITSQNHGFVVDEESLKGTDLTVTHRCVNDGSIEGLQNEKHKAFSVQFHPESAPGPHDGKEIFNKFKDLMEGK